MKTLWNEHFAPPVTYGAEDIVPAVAGLASGLAEGGRFRTSLFRRHLQTAAANLVAAVDLSGLPPYGGEPDDDSAWSERFYVYPQTVSNILNLWLADGMIALKEDGRDREFRMRSTEGMAELVRRVLQCEEGLRCVRADLLLLSVVLPATYDFGLIAKVHPELKTAKVGIGPDPKRPLAECWNRRWAARRFIALLSRRRDLLRMRTEGVLALRGTIAPLVKSNRSVPEALEIARDDLGGPSVGIYPGLFAWKRQRTGDLDPGVDRLAMMYRSLPDEVARRDFLGGMEKRARVLYGGMADTIDRLIALLAEAAKTA